MVINLCIDCWRQSIKQVVEENGNREFVEASPMDRIWGVGFEETNGDSKMAEWGINLIGKALTEASRMIREDGEIVKNEKA